MKKKKILIFFFFFFTYHTNVFSIPDGVSLKTKVSKTNLNIADTFFYTFTITYPKNIKASKPSIHTNLGEFLIKDYQFKKKEISNNFITEEIKYLLTIYQVGTFSLPSPVIKLKKGPVFKEVKAASITISVKSLLKGKETIAPIKPIISLNNPFSIFKIISFIFIILLLLVGVYYAFFSKEKHKNQKRLPFEESYFQIKVLLKKKWIEQKKYKPFYYTFSKIIKNYLETTYLIPATKMSTNQLKKAVKAHHLENALFYIEVLEYADLVKFSLFSPDNKKTFLLLKTFTMILDKTREQIKMERNFSKKKT